jgi:nucleoside-diphosphate-sugar epimerase
VINKIKFLIGRGIPKFGAIKMRKDEIEASFPHLEKIKRTFNWKPLINLEKGLDNTILFYKKNNFDV